MNSYPIYRTFSNLTPKQVALIIGLRISLILDPIVRPTPFRVNLRPFLKQDIYFKWLDFVRRASLWALLLPLTESMWEILWGLRLQLKQVYIVMFLPIIKERLKWDHGPIIHDKHMLKIQGS